MKQRMTQQNQLLSRLILQPYTSTRRNRRQKTIQLSRYEVIVVPIMVVEEKDKKERTDMEKK